MSRYETPTRGHGIGEGLAARAADPLWLLGRQWQFGEYRHENAASPAWVEISMLAHFVDESRTADGPSWQPFDVVQAPLERIVEEHGGGPSPRLRLEGGLRLRRALTAAGRPGDLAAFLAHCPFPAAPMVDAADAALRSALPDGELLASCFEQLADAGARDAEFAALRGRAPLASTAAQLADLAQEWLSWWRPRVPAIVPEADDCWDEHRLEHRFALRASGLPGVELRASEYTGGRLDWSSVDAVAVDEQPTELVGPLQADQVCVPAPARFGGMPAPRFWEMEDARFDPGSIDAAPIDLGRLMLAGYATVYGNDWFVAPVRLPVATLSRVVRFVVHDVFQQTTELTEVATDQDGWNLFGLTQADQPLTADQERPTSPWFFLPPSLPGSLESAPTDIVMLLRDEVANVAWAVEAVVGDDQGRPRDRFAQWAAREVVAPAASEVPAYHVASEVPDHWFPLVPEQFADHESIRLRLVPLTRMAGSTVTQITPTGTLLPAGDVWLHEEEVPRSGVQVVRTWQHARWHDGSRHLWRARRKLGGHGEGDSGLRFDELQGS